MIVPARTLPSRKVVPAFQIDDSLAAAILRVKWSLDRDGYLGGMRKKKHRSLAYVVFCLANGRPPAPGLQIDHVNGDKLDNRACNLEEVTQLENLRRRPRAGKLRSEANRDLPKGIYRQKPADNRGKKLKGYTVYLWSPKHKKLLFGGSYTNLQDAVAGKEKLLSTLEVFL